MNDARIRFGRAELLGGDQRIHIGRQPATLHLELLFAEDVVGHDDESPARCLRRRRERQRAGDHAPRGFIGAAVAPRHAFENVGARFLGAGGAKQPAKPLDARVFDGPLPGQDLQVQRFEHHPVFAIEVGDGPHLKRGRHVAHDRKRVTRGAGVIEQGVVEIADERARHKSRITLNDAVTRAAVRSTSVMASSGSY